jgi:hypothetical protein
VPVHTRSGHALRLCGQLLQLGVLKVLAHLLGTLPLVLNGNRAPKQKGEVGVWCGPGAVGGGSQGRLFANRIGAGCVPAVLACDVRVR